MNATDFQDICADIHGKYAHDDVSEADITLLADILVNTLGQDDLKANGTEFFHLANRTSDDFKGNADPSPELCRIYELCRMYNAYRPRPLTALERDEARSRAGKEEKKAVTFAVYADGTPVANCWFEDLHDTASVAETASEIARGLPEWDAADPDRMMNGIAEALSGAGGKIDPLDDESVKAAGDLPASAIGSDSGSGVICLGQSQERNRARRGAEVKIDMSGRRIRMDCYTVYGVEFYDDLTGNASRTDVGRLEELPGWIVEYPFDKASDAARAWQDLAEPFAIPGSAKLVGVKKALSPKRPA